MIPTLLLDDSNKDSSVIFRRVKKQYTYRGETQRHHHHVHSHLSPCGFTKTINQNTLSTGALIELSFIDLGSVGGGGGGEGRMQIFGVSNGWLF